MASFNGTWLYRSFCPARGTNEREPQITAPWSPLGVMDVVSDAAGKVYGDLVFGAGQATEVRLKISGTLTPERGDLPEAIDLIGNGPNGSVTQLRGYFVSGKPAYFLPMLERQASQLRRN
jgi:hypothetical protein